jgi:hypothetical protein
VKAAATTLLALAAVGGLAVCRLLLGMYATINARPGEWMGGVDSDLPILWLLIAGIGGAYLGLASVLALLGVVFARNRRGPALWLLVIPGVVGILLAGGALALLVANQPDWQQHGLVVVAALAFSPLVFTLGGLVFRRANPRRSVAPAVAPVAHGQAPPPLR